MIFTTCFFVLLLPLYIVIADVSCVFILRCSDKWILFGGGGSGGGTLTVDV